MTKGEEIMRAYDKWRNEKTVTPETVELLFNELEKHIEVVSRLRNFRVLAPMQSILGGIDNCLIPLEDK